MPDVRAYDAVILGYPNWWGMVPMAVNTFLEEYDFAGKTLIPFCSHEGSGLGSSMSVIPRQCEDAPVLDGLAVRGREAAHEGTKAEVERWLREIGRID